MASDGGNRRANGREKLAGEAGICAWYHAPYLRRASLARTSPQDLAADGLRACTRRRLASSLRCASVTGMASGVATRLSQSSSISSSRSSTLSERACLSTVLMFAFSAGSPQAARIMSVRITLRVSGGAVEHGTWRPRDHAVRSRVRSGHIGNNLVQEHG